MADSYPYGIFGQDPENITYGTDTKKAAEQLAKFRASLRASEDIVGGEPRLVSDTTPSGFPSSKYGAGDAFNQTLRDEDFNNAYLEGRKLGLSDRDAKMVARLKIGQDATQASTENTMLRQAINETEMTDLRRALTEQASESLDPYIGPDYRDQANFDTPAETPSTKKAIQQSQSTPISSSVKGPRFAGKYAKYVIPLLGGTSGLYLLADALSDNEAERMPAPVDEDETAKLAAAELLAQAVS